MLFEPYLRFHIFNSVRVTEWHLLGNRRSLGLRYVFFVQVPKCHFSFFPPLGLWSGGFFLIVPFPEHCLLVLFFKFIIFLSLLLMDVCV